MNHNFEENTVYQLMKVAKILKNKLDSTLKNYDITASQFSVLNIIHQKTTELTSAEIASSLSSDRPTISGIILRLEQKGMIVRKENPLDRREEKISLTQKAQSNMATVIEKSNQISREVELLINQSELNAFNRVLLDIIEKFGKEEADEHSK